jgi:nucleoside 2-deoxyribosyltransferase
MGMRVYVASSWRNQEQQSVVEALRQAGHEVYDFRNPAPGNTGFHWSSIDPNWQSWTPEQYREALKHPVAEQGFSFDMDALVNCDAVVAVQPFGRSASLELGWAVGAGKFTVLLLADGEPELMVKMVDCICLDLGDVVEALS